MKTKNRRASEYRHGAYNRPGLWRAMAGNGSERERVARLAQWVNARLCDAWFEAEQRKREIWEASTVVRRLKDEPYRPDGGWGAC